MKLLSIVVAASVLVATAIQAQQSGSESQVQQACSSEVQSLCPGKTGQDAVNCLKGTGSDKISANCKTALQNAEKGRTRKRGGT